MTTTRMRAGAVVLACTALIGAGTTTASAEEVDDLYAGANAVTATLSVLGNDLGSFAGTSAVAEDTPSVRVGSFGFQGPQGTPGVGVTEAVVDALGAEVRDPGAEGDACGVPALAALPVEELLRVLEVCSSSEAALPDLLAPHALGAARAGNVSLNGQALADVIFDLLLDPIMAELDGVVGEVQGALAPVESALAAICDELPEELSATALAAEADAAGLPVTDVIRALPDGEQILESLESDCLLSLETLVEIVAAVPAIAESVVRDTLLAALDRDLLTVALGSSASSITSIEDALVAEARLRALDVSTLSLDFLLDALQELLTVHIQGVLDDVVAAIPAELDAVTSQLPALADVLTPVLDQLVGAGLIDDAPLLQVTVADSLARARSLPGGDSVDTAGSKAGGVSVKISPAIAGLLGIPAEVQVAPGERVAVAEGTPLESVVTVGAVEQITEVLGASEVQTAGSRVTATEVALLTGVQGGIVAGTGVTEARVGGSTIAVPSDPGTPKPSLPRTGSSDDLSLLLGMGVLVLFAAGLGVRRRID
jgi:LPXTG-motif cell wall-anchored protein